MFDLMSRSLPLSLGTHRERVEKNAARGARISHAKTAGPVAQRLMGLPWIDWNTPAQEDAAALE
jgi:hypothetical protein